MKIATHTTLSLLLLVLPATARLVSSSSSHEQRKAFLSSGGSIVTGPVFGGGNDNPFAASPGDVGADCSSNICQDDLVCHGGTCKATLSGECRQHDDCTSGFCAPSAKVCGLKPHGFSCDSNAECSSGHCAVDNTCECNTATQVAQQGHIASAIGLLESLETNLNGCRANVDSINDIVDVLEKVAAAGTLSTRVAAAIGTVLDRITDMVQKVGPVIFNIPKVGPVLVKLTKALELLEIPLQKIGDVHSTLNGMETVLETAELILTGSEALLLYEETLAGLTASALESALTTSADHYCCAHTPIYAYASQFLNPDEQWQTVYQAVQVCDSLSLDLLNLVLPDFALLEDILLAIQSFVEDVEAFVKSAHEKFVAKVDIVTCCNEGVNFLARFMEYPSNIVDLTSCWVDGAIQGIPAEALDALLGELEPLVTSYNHGFVAKVNSEVIDFLNDLVVAFSLTLHLPSISVDLKDSCAVEIETSTVPQELVDIDLSLSIPHFEEIDLDSDGSFDWNAIGQGIQQDCNDAWNAFTDPSALDDCCCAAREAVGIACDGKALGETCAVGRGECNSGHCGLSAKVCVDTCFLNDKDCPAGHYCDRDQVVCAPQLPNGQSCGLARHNSCLSGYCKGGTCTATCQHDHDCNSHQFCGHDGVSPNYKYCKDQKERYGTCNRDRQCQSGTCSGLSLCTKP